MPDSLTSLLEELTTASGPSGFEGPVRAIVRRELQPHADAVETDALGSVIARFRGTSSEPRIMLAAHMDEVGLLVRRITDEGFIKFQPLGGWLDQALINQRWNVITRDGPIPGVTGIKSVHVVKPDARGRVFGRDEMFIDVGAADADDARERLSIRVGDPIVPDSPFAELAGGDQLLGKAWDDRAGVAVMLLVARGLRTAAPPPNTVYAVATVQEEVGLRGAQTSSHVVDPDIGISLESGVAADYPGVTPEEAQERLGHGPSLFLHDSSMLPNTRLRDLCVEVAEELDIPLQFSVLSGYGQDASAMQRARGGAATINIAVPTRYLHSHNSVVARSDIEYAATLTAALLRRLDAETVAAIRSFE